MAELAERDDELENALLAARVDVAGRGAAAAQRPGEARGPRRLRARASELGELQADASAAFNRERARADRARARRSRPSSRGDRRPGRAQRGGEGHLAARARARARRRRARDVDDAWARLRERWFDRLLGADRDDVPSQFHSAYMRRLSPLESTYTKERASRSAWTRSPQLGFELDGVENIHLDLDDRPQKSPRACVIASDPPKVVHLITRAHGRAPRLPGVHARGGARAPLRGLRPVAAVHVPPALARPRADGDLLVHLRGDHARAGLARALLRLSTSEAARERGGDDLPRGAALPPLRRRSSSSSSASGRASRPTAATPEGYAERLTTRDRARYRADEYLADMDAGFYSADYLRAWIRSAQLRAYLDERFGEDWWRDARDRRASCAGSSPRARGRRARRSPRGSASTRTTPAPLLEELGRIASR